MGITIYRNQRIGEIPPTPATSIIDDSVTPDSVKVLREYGSILGHPVSYVQEQNGRLIQNLVPVHKTEYQQISTSSKVELEMHTESSFHPFRPSYVLLLCLRVQRSRHMRAQCTTTWPNEFPRDDHPQHFLKGWRVINMWKTHMGMVAHMVSIVIS